MDTTKSVLIVDDDPAIVEVLSLMLEDAGYDVRMLREGETLEAQASDDMKYLLGRSNSSCA